MKHHSVIRKLALAAAVFTATAMPQLASAQFYNPQRQKPSERNTRPPVFQQVGIDQKLGNQVPLDLQFKDETGKAVRLGDYFTDKPVVLTLVYYDCPMLCTQILNGLTGTLAAMKFDLGKEFEVITVSIDPRETPELAMGKKKVYLDRYKRAGADKGWHFLTGEQSQIEALAAAVGYRYAWDEPTKQWAHGSAIMVATPQGKLSQYFYGIEYSPKDLRLALVESSQGKIGNVVDTLMLYCYHYDPTTGKYGAIAMNIMRLGALTTMFVLGTFLVVMFRRDIRQGSKGAAAAAKNGTKLG